MASNYRRNVFFYDDSSQEMLGGFYQNSSITQQNFINLLHIVLVVESHSNYLPHPFTIFDISRNEILPTDEALAIGNYYIVTAPGDSVTMTDEPHIRRIPSYPISDRNLDFTLSVQNRDRKCVISGDENFEFEIDDWTGFHACHVFPLEKEEHWIRQGFDKWIPNADPGSDTSLINSVQNGLLMQTQFHQLFVKYYFGINPDDNYKITCFRRDNHNIDGKHLDPVCRNENDPNRVPDQYLRWHFRQCVLANMRGAGEKTFESDFSSCNDMIAEFNEAPHARERLEMEVYHRLRIWDGWNLQVIK